jgi:hypothetical protein
VQLGGPAGTRVSRQLRLAQMLIDRLPTDPVIAGRNRSGNTAIGMLDLLAGSARLPGWAVRLGPQRPSQGHGFQPCVVHRIQFIGVADFFSEEWTSAELRRGVAVDGLSS